MMANTSTAQFDTSLQQVFKLGGSVSIYMGHGGTNFGWWAGANIKGQLFLPHITSYDYDCEISEAGDHGYGSEGFDKYVATKNVLMTVNHNSIPPEPAFNPKTAYGPISFTEFVSFWDVKSQLCKNPIQRSGKDRLDFEAMDIPHGFALYSFAAQASNSKPTLTLNDLHDRATIFVNSSFAGSLYRPQTQLQFSANAGRALAFDVLVESMGHQNFGPPMIDPKGVSSVSVGSSTVSKFSVCALTLDEPQLQSLVFGPLGSTSVKANVPTFFRGTFQIDTVTDTFLDFTAWTKGIVWVNGFHLGRYWTIGPQYALYVPAPFLVSGLNEVVVLELEPKAQSAYEMPSIDHPIFVH
jgi:beta-galactosidase